MITAKFMNHFGRRVTESGGSGEVNWQGGPGGGMAKLNDLSLRCVEWRRRLNLVGRR